MKTKASKSRCVTGLDKLNLFQSYSVDTALGSCTHHPGVPIFHEGMKFWSCCQRKTSDFTAFLEQVGCTEGRHKWIRDNVSEQFFFFSHSLYYFSWWVALWPASYHPLADLLTACPPSQALCLNPYPVKYHICAPCTVWKETEQWASEF